jgi:SAM-dependent methyltransferase
MTPAEVAKSYDLIAEHWNSDRFARANGIAQHERALNFLEHKGCALDIGCGCSGRFIDLLLSHSFEVDGVDHSERMIELARRRHPQLEFWHADICDWQYPRRYDFITAWDSYWHVPLAAQSAVLTEMLGALTPGGVCIFTTPGVDAPTEKTDSAMGPPMYYSGLGVAKVLEVIAESGCVCRHLEFDQHPELHLYLIVQRAG